MVAFHMFWFTYHPRMHLLVELEVILQEDPGSFLSLASFCMVQTSRMMAGEETPALRGSGRRGQRPATMVLRIAEHAWLVYCMGGALLLGAVRRLEPSKSLRPPADTLDVPCTFASMASPYGPLSVYLSLRYVLYVCIIQVHNAPLSPPPTTKFSGKPLRRRGCAT